MADVINTILSISMAVMAVLFLYATITTNRYRKRIQEFEKEMLQAHIALVDEAVQLRAIIGVMRSREFESSGSPPNPV